MIMAFRRTNALPPSHTPTALRALVTSYLRLRSPPQPWHQLRTYGLPKVSGTLAEVVHPPSFVLPETSTTGRWSGDQHDVLLMAHARHAPAVVLPAIVAAVPGTDVAYAVACLEASEKYGEALVCRCLKEHAEFRARLMTDMGCRDVRVRPSKDA